MKLNWKKIEDGFWKHNSGKYFIQLYNCGEWYGELQDSEQNTIVLVAYTSRKSAGLKACTKARRVLNTVAATEELLRRYPPTTHGWDSIVEREYKKMTDAENAERQKASLLDAIASFREALEDLKDSNGADQLNTGAVCDCWNYEEMILYLIKGIQMLYDSFEEE